jgi:hypothetical protein
MDMKMFTGIVIVMLLLAAPVFSAEEGFKFYKSPEIRQQKIKKPVRIKLKRLENGKYTWELTGDSAEDVIEEDKKLREYIKQR